MHILRKILMGVAVVLGTLAFVNPAIASLSYNITSPASIALAASNYTASGVLTVSLGYEPAPGTVLTVVKNMGLTFINGKFDNVPQGGIVSLSYGGKTYNFVANYYGGNGRSLVLQWRCVELAAWGRNAEGQLGNNGLGTSPEPKTLGTLARKTVLSVAGGYGHSLALTSEGKVYAWGYNIYGQLGDNSHAQRLVPVAVGSSVSAPLADKTVVAIAAGSEHSLALTSDGIVYSWGCNGVGQLGIGSTTDSTLPVPVNSTAWSGKTVVAIAAGYKHSLAITSDGRVYAWGSNVYGQLGDGGTTSSLVPVRALETLGKPVLAVAAGTIHNLALTFDGQVYAWGYNAYGQLGDGTQTQSSLPVAVNTEAWSGQTVTAIAAGESHSLALTNSGQIFAWGSNEKGQLGSSGTTQSPLPLVVAPNWPKPVAIAAGSQHSMVVTADGGAYVWGSNSDAQLGRSGVSNSPAPARVVLGVLAGLAPVQAIAGGDAHTLALVGSSITAHPVDRTVAEGSTATFTAAADLSESSVQWQISPTGNAGPFYNLGVTTATLTMGGVSLAQSGFAYRAVFTNTKGAVSITAPATLTVLKRQNDLVAVFTTGSDVALTADSVAISGSLTAVLTFAPRPGTNLTVIKNNGPAWISGTFDNVPQGGTVPLTYEGVTYNYIANYYGGNGRSLVLQWPCTGLATWGENYSDQYYTTNAVPVVVPTSGALAGKTVVAIAGGGDCGSFHLAVTSNGQVFGWGVNDYGQLGNGVTESTPTPVAVDTTGVLAQKTVIAVAAGGVHSLALTSSGEVFAWGYNSSGQLGNGGTTLSAVPVAVNTTGAMAGKTVVAIAAGGVHSLALTSDGQVYAWGRNDNGQLGDSATAGSAVPVLLSDKGALLGKTIVAIAAGQDHNLALTSDGQIIAWGNNSYGQLGDGLGYSLWTPVAVNINGALAGKTVTAIAAGGNHSMAITQDGAVVTWGNNSDGQLGISGIPYSTVPVNIDNQGVWSGKAITAIGAGYAFSTALTEDGRVFAWGDNYWGELGNNSTASSSVPVPVDTTGPLNGKVVLDIASSSRNNLAFFALGAPSVTTHPVSQTVTCGATATFTAAAAAGNYPLTIQWQKSWTGTDGPFQNIEDNPTATTGTLKLTNVMEWDGIVTYRALFTNAAGNSATSAAGLSVVNGQNLQAIFTSATGIALEADSVILSGSLDAQLAFAPEPGTNLTVIKNNGLAWISGTFSNIPQGGTVTLTFDGKTYNYIANYYGGNGRSLVLQSTCVGLGGWGNASRGALGYPTGSAFQPIVVNPIQAMAGKTVTAIAGGDAHSMALTADGRVFAWGANDYGQLGNNGTGASYAPQAVGGLLANKTVVALAAAERHSLALTAEGEVFAWGENYCGQLGNGTGTNSSAPVAVNTSGGLAGKTVVAISAGGFNSMALTSDGKIFVWGSDSDTSNPTPVEVNTGGALAGKTVVAIAAGVSFNLALTSDGLVFAWGRNDTGQLGNGTRTSSSEPVAVDASGVLSGKKVVAIAVGRNGSGGHSLALTSDGLLFAWGQNDIGSLGNGDNADSLVPVAVSTSGQFGSKTVTAIAAGEGYSMALTSDGQVFTWGDGYEGVLGNTFGNSEVPAPVSATSVLAEKKITTLAAGFHHNLVLFGLNPPTVTADPVDSMFSPFARGIFTASASDFPAITTVQWQVSTTGSDGVFTDIKDNQTATTGTLDMSYSAGPQSGITYRAVFTNLAGTSVSKTANLLYPPPVIAVPDDITVNADQKDGAWVGYTVTAIDPFEGSVAASSTPSPCTIFPIGTTTVHCSATNSHGVASTASFTVTVLRTYAAFQDEHGLGNTDPLADLNHTGVSNLAAYAFGLDPAAPERSRLPSAQLQNGSLQISFTRWKDAADLNYIVEVSSDLKNWESGSGNTEQVMVTPIDGEPSREQVIIRDLNPTLDTSRRFIRVRIKH